MLETAGSSEEIESGSLRCAKCARTFAIDRGIPRFVPSENYAGNFGFQWNAFRETQLDSHSGVPISRERFFASTGFPERGLEGKRILDVGCGAGRFAEIALSTGATVYALDYSSAIDAARANLGKSDHVHFLQGDIFALPFKKNSFDYVYCLGVLQHTPDPHRAFLSLPAQVAPGGRLAVDVYPWQLRNVLVGKYWARLVTKHMKAERLFPLVQKMVPVLLPISRVVGRVPVIGRKARQVIPISNYDGIYPLSEKQIREWAVLDTFDMLSPAHDHPQTAKTLRAWMHEAGMHEVEVFRHGHIVARGRR